MNFIDIEQLIKEILFEIEDQPSEETPENEPETQPKEEGEIKKRISKREAAQLIKSTKGKFFTVYFTKKDGTSRIMNARLGVKAYLKGGTLPYNPDEKGLIPVFDAQTKGYRMINTNTINKIIIDKTEYEVI